MAKSLTHVTRSTGKYGSAAVHKKAGQERRKGDRNGENGELSRAEEKKEGLARVFLPSVFSRQKNQANSRREDKRSKRSIATRGDKRRVTRTEEKERSRRRREREMERSMREQGR